MSPGARRSPQETREASMERHARAGRLREALQEQRQARLAMKKQKTEDAKSMQEERGQAMSTQLQSRFDDKIARSTELRQQHIAGIVQKAGEERRKVAEVAFINRLEEEDRKLALLQKLEEGEARRQALLEEVLARSKEATAAAEEAARRRGQIEELRRSDLASKIAAKAQRKDQAQARLEEERRAAAAVREAARERQVALLGQVEAQRASLMVVRGARIEDRLKEAASRRRSHLELIKDKCVLGLSRPERPGDGEGSPLQSPAAAAAPTPGQATRRRESFTFPPASTPSSKRAVERSLGTPLSAAAPLYVVPQPSSTSDDSARTPRTPTATPVAAVPVPPTEPSAPAAATATLSAASGGRGGGLLVARPPRLRLLHAGSPLLPRSASPPRSRDRSITAPGSAKAQLRGLRKRAARLARTMRAGARFRDASDEAAARKFLLTGEAEALVNDWAVLAHAYRRADDSAGSSSGRADIYGGRLSGGGDAGGGEGSGGAASDDEDGLVASAVRPTLDPAALCALVQRATADIDRPGGARPSVRLYAAAPSGLLSLLAGVAAGTGGRGRGGAHVSGSLELLLRLVQAPFNCTRLVSDGLVPELVRAAMRELDAVNARPAPAGMPQAAGSTPSSPAGIPDVRQAAAASSGFGGPRMSGSGSVFGGGASVAAGGVGGGGGILTPRGLNLDSDMSSPIHTPIHRHSVSNLSVASVSTTPSGTHAGAAAATHPPKRSSDEGREASDPPSTSYASVSSPTHAGTASASTHHHHQHRNRPGSGLQLLPLRARGAHGDAAAAAAAAAATAEEEADLQLLSLLLQILTSLLLQSQACVQEQQQQQQGQQQQQLADKGAPPEAPRTAAGGAGSSVSGGGSGDAGGSHGSAAGIGRPPPPPPPRPPLRPPVGGQQQHQGTLHTLLCAHYLSCGLVGRCAELLSLMDQPRTGLLSRPIPAHVVQGLQLLRALTLRPGNPTLSLTEDCKWRPAAPNAAAISLAFEETSLCCLPSMLTAVLLHAAPSCVPADAHAGSLPANFVEVATLVMRVLNNLARLDLPTLQGSLGSSGLRVEFLHLANFLLAYCSQQWGRVVAPPPQQQQQQQRQQQQPTQAAQQAQQALAKAQADAQAAQAQQQRSIECLLNEVLHLLGFFTLLCGSNQAMLTWGRHPSCVLTSLCHLPFDYFSSPVLSGALLPTLLSVTFHNAHNCNAMSAHVGLGWLLSALPSELQQQVPSQQQLQQPPSQPQQQQQQAPASQQQQQTPASQQQQQQPPPSQQQQQQPPPMLQQQEGGGGGSGDTSDERGTCGSTADSAGTERSLALVPLARTPP
ncbi:hypothetical protein FOA52_000947 [Chlamydomonas sp. UWO 241]|nr:hypothetical protein FOA52_000947 [Chlamydomonas sp. UWO 241]